MTSWILDHLPWLLSANTIYMTLLAGNKHTNAWLIGLLNQILWLIWIVGTQTWGLIPLNVALWIVYTRNHFKWKFDMSGKPSEKKEVNASSIRDVVKKMDLRFRSTNKVSVSRAHLTREEWDLIRSKIITETKGEI